MAAQNTYILNIGARTTTGYDRTMNKLQKGFKSITGGFKMAGRIASLSFSGRQILQWGKDAAETYKAFESSMKNTAAIMDATTMEYEMLEKASREAGRTTTKTASEAADALGYMALAGWDAKDSAEGLIPILKLSEATQKDLKTTSDLVTDSMSALGIGVGGMGDYLDKLIATNNNANTSAEQLMYALVKTGGAARVMGMSMEDITTATGILANNGLKGSEAGTALNSILKRLSSNKSAVDMLDEMNISLYDAEDNFRGFKAVLQDINKYLEGAGADEKNIVMSKLGGRFYSQVEYLLDSVRESTDGAGTAWDDLNGKIENSNGALAVMNKTATSTLEASQKLLESAYQDLQISAVDIFAEDFKDAMRYIASELPETSSRLAQFESEHHDEIVSFLNMAAEGIVDLANAAIDLGDWLMDNGPAVEGIITGILTGKAVSGATRLASAFGEAVTAAGGFMPLLSNPVMWGVVGISAAVGGVAALRQHLKKVREEAKKASLDEHFGNIALSATDIEEAANRILGEGNISRMNTFADELSKIEGYISNIDMSTGELKRLNWKVTAGITLNEADKEAYKEAADALVKNVQQYIDSQGYSLNLAQTLLGGEGTDYFSMDFWNYQSAQANELGVRLNKAIGKALKDGIIDPDKELPHIMRLQNELIKMQQEVEAAKYDAEFQALEDNIDALSFEEIIKRTNELSEEQAASLHDAYTTNLGNLKYQLGKGAISQYEYSTQKEALDKDYVRSRAGSASRVGDTLLGQIKQSYSGEIESLTNGLNLDRFFAIRSANEMGNARVDFSQMLERAYSIVNQYRNNISESNRDAINQLLEDMLPTEQQYEEIIQKCKSLGQSVPESVAEGIREIRELRALTGSEDDIWSYVYSTAINNESYNQLIDAVGEDSQGIRDTLAEYIDDYSVIDAGVDNLYSHTQEYLTRKFSSGFNVRVDVKPDIKMVDPLGLLTVKAPNTLKKVAKNAAGGIYDSPLLTTFAEEGPEAAIPINQKPRSIALWEKAGEMMGLNPSGGTVSYSPQITIQGNATKEDVVEAERIGLAEFRKMYREMMRQDQRVAFAR